MNHFPRIFGDANQSGHSPVQRKLFQLNSKSLCIRSLLLIVAIALTLSSVTWTRTAGAAADPQDDRKAKDAKANAYRDGKKAIRSGKYAKAIEIYRELLEADPEDVQSLLGMALAHAKELNYGLCYDRAVEAIKLDPATSRGHALSGFALLRSGFVRDAIIELNEAFRLDPKEALAWGAAAEIDYYEGRSRESREKALKAFSLDPEEPDYLITYARSSSRVEAFQDAADAYERFLEIAPETDHERRARIKGLIAFYRRLTGLEIHQLTGPRSTDLSFQLGTDRRPYIQLRMNNKIATFVVDTGSGFTVISKEAAKKFRVSEIARGGTSQGVGGDGKFDIVYGLIKNLQLGDVKIKSIPCFIRPFHGSKDRPAEERADGFIGLSVLSHFLTEIDYKNSVMRLDRDGEKTTTAAAPPPDTTIVPFRTTQNGLISIETELDGNHRINAILDSGASSTVISTAAVNRLKMRDSIIKGQTVRV
ncbi:MAG TPA: aspartyl protease family protein, partial [Blastocatellia bacterium]|nr:aspartyl protease family protein [Blastocatellia bacterium]